MILCSEHIQVKMHGLKGTLCDSLDQPTTVMLRVFLLFIHLFWFWIFRLQGQRVDAREQGDE